MNACHETCLQRLIILLTFVFGVLSPGFLPVECLYSLGVVTWPFLAGFAFVMLTRRSRRDSTSGILLSLVGSVGMGIMGLSASHVSERAEPYAIIQRFRVALWGPFGETVYLSLVALAFVVVPIACFIAGRALADKWRGTVERA